MEMLVKLRQTGMKKLFIKLPWSVSRIQNYNYTEQTLISSNSLLI